MTATTFHQLVQCPFYHVIHSGAFHLISFNISYYFRGDTANVSDYLNPSHFNDLKTRIDNVKDVIAKTRNPNTSIWIGESADAWHSGTANVSDRFVSGFL